MPSVRHKVISAVLFFLAAGAWALNSHHTQASVAGSTAENKVWHLKHRGYPSLFGYLSHHWGLRVVESEIESQVRQNGETTVAHRMDFFDSQGLMGFVTIQFEANLRIEGGDSLKLDVDKSTIKITDHSDDFDLASFNPYLDDLLHDMYQAQRNIITHSPSEAIIETPYMGIVRVHASSDIRLIVPSS